MNSRFRHNPFSSILKEELRWTLVPRFDVDELKSKINTSSPLAIEFLGKQGRGKTTHLLYLHQQMSQYPLYTLNAASDTTDLLQDESKVIFIDSIHHLRLFDRIRLLKSKKTVVFTTHWSRQLECYYSQKHLHTIRFKGIDQQTLKEIIQRRETLASKSASSEEASLVSDAEVKTLITEYGDNYRGILNHLYEKFQ